MTQKYPHFPTHGVPPSVFPKNGYVGWRDDTDTAHAARVDGRALDPRLDLDNHSPTGFEWGYGGSGPAQLALAILADYTRDDQLALNLHQRFKFKVIGSLKRNDTWHLRDADIANAIEAIQVDLARSSS